MKLNPFLLLAAGVFTLAGCSSTPTKVDTGAIHARTFSFVDRGNRPEPGFADDRQPVHAMIQQAITKNLAARGVSNTAAGGDVIVGYLIITGNNIYTKSINEYFGYGSDAAALHDKAHDMYTSGKNPNYFEAGTLIIDIIDAKTFKLLQRGHATRTLLKNINDATRAARIEEVVNEILHEVRFEP